MRSPVFALPRACPRFLGVCVVEHAGASMIFSALFRFMPFATATRKPLGPRGVSEVSLTPPGSHRHSI